MRVCEHVYRVHYVEEIRKAREEGVDVRARADAAMLDDVDDEEKPDEEIEVPDNKVKLIIGAGGENIKKIQKKSKARLQVKKKGEELNKGFGGLDFEEEQPAAAGGAVDGGADGGGGGGGSTKMTTFMLFGSEEERAAAKRMIHELFDRAEAEKREKREKDREWQKKKKERERQMYHLRHKADYDCLEVHLGASKEECKKAYRKLAVRWHPDKHPVRRRRPPPLARAHPFRSALCWNTTLSGLVTPKRQVFLLLCPLPLLLLLFAVFAFFVYQ